MLHGLEVEIVLGSRCSENLTEQASGGIYGIC